MTRRHYNWAALVKRLRERPARWVLEFPNEPTRLAKRIRLRQHPDLRHDDGAVEVMILNTYRRDAEQPRGDIWVRWVYHQHTTNTTNKE